MVKHKTFKIIWDVNALNDFVEILEFLSKKGNQAPRIVKQGILTRLEVIRKNAFICEVDRLRILRIESSGPLWFIVIESLIK